MSIPAAVRYAIDTPLRPPITETVRYGELARLAAMSQYGQRHGGATSQTLSGKQPDGQPLAAQHQHAFYLPADEDGDGWIDHITITSALGFTSDEIAALTSLQRLWESEREQEFPLRFLGAQPLTTWQETHPRWAPAQQWESVTPYLLTRFPKQHRDGRPKLNEMGEQRDGPEEQIRREWQLRQQQDPTLPDLQKIERKTAHHIGEREIDWLTFRRFRLRGGGTATGLAYGLHLHFKNPTPGPLALGYGCHYGLGQFQAKSWP